MKSSEHFHSLASSDTVSRLSTILHEPLAHAQACQKFTLLATTPQSTGADFELPFSFDPTSFPCALNRALESRSGDELAWPDSISESWGFGFAPLPG
jgi:hypothetical protein